MSSICLNTCGFARNTVCQILSSSVKLKTYDVWRKFCECLGCKDFQSKNTHHQSKKHRVYLDIYDLLTRWCDLKPTESTLESLLEVLDRCELWQEFDILRETFSLAPRTATLPGVSISSDVLQEFGEHVSKNCSVLTNSTIINNSLLKYLQESCSSEALKCSIATINNSSLDSPTKGYAFYSAIRNNPECLQNVIFSLEKDGQYKPAWILRRAFRKFDIMETVFKPIACNPYVVDKIVGSAFSYECNKGLNFSQIFHMLFPEFGQFSPSMKSFLGILSTFVFTDGSTKEQAIVKQLFKTLHIQYSEADGIFQFWVYLVKTYGILWDSKDEFPMIFNFMNVFPIQQTRVVILGQYPSPLCKPSGFAYHGCKSRSIQTILENLNFELKLLDRSLEIPSEILEKYQAYSLLDGWLEQGVLMFNVLLTLNNIWSEFTNFLIKYLSVNYSNMVFIITGKLAAETVYLIDQDKHAVFKVYLPIPAKHFRWEDVLPLINTNFYFYQVTGNPNLIDWGKVSSKDKRDRLEREQQHLFLKYKELFDELLKKSNPGQMKNKKCLFKCFVSLENVNTAGETDRKLQIAPLSKILCSPKPASQKRSQKIRSILREVSMRYHKTNVSLKS